MPRLAVVAFPSFFALARLGENRAADRVILVVSSLFLALLNTQFANGYWVA
jgi:hypothetical protein